MNETMCYGGLTAAPGQKTQGYAPLGDSGFSFPVTLINGCRRGKTVLISAGIHGGEYPGILTAMELAAELRPEDLSGRLILFHPVNVSAFLNRVSYVHPEIGENLNRLYPGSPDGSAAERLAHYMTEEYHRRVDFVLDLHGGDLHEELPPYVYSPGIGDPAVLSASLAAARLVHARYLVRSTASTGFYNSCAITGTPAILIERGCKGLWSRAEVDAYKADVKNLLTHLGLLPGCAAAPAEPAYEITRASYIDAGASGFWFPLAEVEEHARAGQLLGKITDPFGNVLEEIRAAYDCIVLYRAVSLGIKEGDPLLTYGI